MESKDIPVLLLTGYLGSGKTTLLNRILTNRRGIKFAVIVNDIGEVNIDASLIQKGGIVGQDGGKNDDLVALSNGCICCTLKMDLVEQLGDLARSGNFDYIVIEASGICEPEPIARTICAIRQLDPRIAAGEALPRLDCIVTVVDALRLKSEFESGSRLERNGIDEEDIENLIIQQIEFCNIILLNKVSEVTAGEAAHIRSVIKALQPKARIIDCDYADVPLDAIINTGIFNYEDVATSATWVREIERSVTEAEEAEAHGHHHHDHDDHHEHDHEGHHHHHDEEHEEHHHHHHDDDDSCGKPGHGEHCHHHHHDGEGEAEEYGIQTMVYYRRRPFDIHKLDRFVATKWPANVIRTKGVLYFQHQPDMSFLFEQAGVQKKLSEAGLWYATAPANELAEMIAREPGLAKDWDAVYGDRMIKLVFIGQHLDREALAAELDACLGELPAEK
ncbi:MAG: GTP-binding protein [Clostridiales bacterium]|nr:GTP-binding protein [Clostridiales bacterium]